MSIFDKLFQSKQSRALTVVSMQDVGQPKSSPKNYDAFAQQGYQLNVICYDAVQKVAKGLGSIEWVLFQKGRGGRKEEIIEHPLLQLLEQPNPMQSKGQFFQMLGSYYQISGNGFIEGVRGTRQQFNELWSLPSSNFKVIPGTKGIPLAYVFKYKGGEQIFEVDQVDGQCDLLHMKNFNPTNMYWGLSSLEPSMLAIDQHNSSMKHNLALLQNGARPAGALKISEGNHEMSEDEFNRLKEQLKDQYSGPQNTGKVMVLEGGMEWEQLGLTPRDLEWLEGNNQNARNIALALGVPPILLNIPGDSTFNNMREARLALYEDTIIPLAKLIRDELNRWLVPAYGDNLYLDIDIDSIDALDLKREAKFERYEKVTYLTPNEKRRATGYDEIEGGDVLQPPKQPIAPAPEAPKFVLPEMETKVKEITVEQFADIASEIKQVNLITPNEKRATARKLDALREFYSKSLERDVQEQYFDAIAKGLSKINTDQKQFAESQALRVIDSRDDDLVKAIAVALKRTAQSFGEPIIDGGKSHWGEAWETKKESDFTTWIDFFVQQRAEEAAVIIKDTTVKQTRSIIGDVIQAGITEGLSVNQIAKEISTNFKQISAPRARVIARTETGFASAQGSLEAAKSLDIPDLKKEWVTATDERVRDDHRKMNGSRLELNEKFNVNGTLMTGPRDPSGPPEQVINCRCVLVFSRR